MEYTPVHNRFWSDGWVRSINALDRYLFLYLLTNGRAKLTGIYELPLDLMGSESGIDEKDLRLSMIQRLEPKIYYREGWVIITNYPKHRIGGGHKYDAGVRANFNEIPSKIQEIAKSYGYPIDTLSIEYRRFPSILDKNRIPSPAKLELVLDLDSDTENPTSLKSKKNTPEMREVYEIFTDNPSRKHWPLRIAERNAAAILHETYGIETLRERYVAYQKHRKEPLCPQVDSPSDFLSKMLAIERFMKSL